MGKPDDIPQSVWGAVNGDATQYGSVPWHSAVFAARAILAERQACAQIVASFDENIGLAKGRLVSAILDRSSN